MRMSVVDVGSNTVRLVVADAEGGVPLPVHTAKWRLRLSEVVGPDGRIPEEAVHRLVGAVAAADETARKWGAAGPLAFATAVVRGAPNRLEVLRAVRAETGVRLCTLPGEEEAELTFLGARRWMGWRAGRSRCSTSGAAHWKWPSVAGGCRTSWPRCRSARAG